MFWARMDDIEVISSLPGYPYFFSKKNWPLKHSSVRVGHVIPLDSWLQGFKIPPGALGTVPESVRPVQVQEQESQILDILECKQGVSLLLVPALVQAWHFQGIIKPCDKRSEGMTCPTRTPYPSAFEDLWS